MTFLLRCLRVVSFLTSLIRGVSLAVVVIQSRLEGARSPFQFGGLYITASSFVERRKYILASCDKMTGLFTFASVIIIEDTLAKAAQDTLVLLETCLTATVAGDSGLQVHAHTLDMFCVVVQMRVVSFI